MRGEHDLANAQAVEGELKAAEATDADHIILDLSGLDFIDSAGIRLIMMTNARLTAHGKPLRLRRGPGHVQRVFEITGTANALTFSD